RRALDPAVLKESQEKGDFLDGIMRKMKEHGELNARFHIRMEMTVQPPQGRGRMPVTAQLPLPIEYAQVKNFQLLSLSHPDAVIAPSDYPQRTVCFRAVPDKPFFVEYTYETHMRYANPDPGKVLEQQPTFYTEEYAPHILFTPYLNMLCAEIIGNEKNPLLKARKIYDFITTKMIYSFMRPYMTMPNVPEYGASSMKGDCGVQALLFITLCRIAGVPARWQSGQYVAPGDEGMHDWAQFYAAPFGWLFADPSFGGSAYRNGNEERWNFYFGNLDPFRLPANSEYQHEFYIPSRHLRYDPYDNQDGEAEWDDAPVPPQRRDTRLEVLSSELF
ncbi:MAG: transglutaminase domain-containing protein, partial [Clostridia bacterium]|nr:transglutaminase domain-containing protein [Clostridia bacterium]